MEEIFEPELIIKLINNDFKNIELKDRQKNLHFHIKKDDNNFQLEISKKINLKEEEFLHLQKEIEKIYTEIKNNPDHWENSNIEYPNLKKLWEFYYQENEKIYKKDGTVTYPENWIPFFDMIEQKYT